MKKLLLLAALPLLAACTATSTPGPTLPGQRSVSSAAPSLEAPKASPYITDGEWLVPSEIEPGTYRAVATGKYGAYVEVCADAACEIGTPGFIENYAFNGTEIISVPVNAFSIKLQSAKLERI